MWFAESDCAVGFVLYMKGSHSADRRYFVFLVFFFLCFKLSRRENKSPGHVLQPRASTTQPSTFARASRVTRDLLLETVPRLVACMWLPPQLTRRTCCSMASCTAMTSWPCTGRRGGGHGSARISYWNGACALFCPAPCALSGPAPCWACTCAPKRPIGAGWSIECQYANVATPATPATPAIKVGRARVRRVDDQLLEAVQRELHATTEARRSHKERLKARGILHVLVGLVVVL